MAGADDRVWQGWRVSAVASCAAGCAWTRVHSPAPKLLARQALQLIHVGGKRVRGIHRGLSAILLAGLGAFATGAVAQEAAPSAFTARLAGVITPFEVNPDGLSGAGGLVLTRAVADSR